MAKLYSRITCSLENNANRYLWARNNVYSKCQITTQCDSNSENTNSKMSSECNLHIRVLNVIHMNCMKFNFLFIHILIDLQNYMLTI